MMIKTERLLIRPIVETDWKSIQHIWDDIKHSPYAQYDNPKDTQEDVVRPRISRWANANKSGTDHLFYAVCLNDTVIGYIAFNLAERGHEIGYCFHSAHHGNGYGKESLSALIRHMESLNIRWLSARTALQNKPSVRLLTSLGFHQTATEQVSFYKNNNGSDIFFTGGIFELNILQKTK